MTNYADEVRSTRAGAGVLTRPDILTIAVSGPDRVRFLNGMLSCDVEKIARGRARRAVKASAKGRVEGMLRVRQGEAAIWLDVLETSAERVATELVRFVVMDDVELADASQDREVLTLVGPRAAEILAQVQWPAPAEDLSFERSSHGVVIRDDGLGLPGFELHVSGKADGIRAELLAAGAEALSEEGFEALRIEAGQPKDGVDVDVDTLPLEARLEDAVDLDKGCYLGQEVIARATHRGGVKHHLVGLRIEGESLPPAGAELWPQDAERSRGEVTSVVHSPTLGGGIGLGYLHVDHEAPGTRVEIRSPEAVFHGEVVELPFVAP